LFCVISDVIVHGSVATKTAIQTDVRVELGSPQYFGMWVRLRNVRIKQCPEVWGQAPYSFDHLGRNGYSIVQIIGVTSFVEHSEVLFSAVFKGGCLGSV